MPPGDNSIRVIAKVAELLSCFTMDRPEWGLVELSTQAGQHPATCHRILKSLIQVGFVVQDPASHKYRLGVKLLELGSMVQAHLQMPREAIDLMRQLVDDVQETAYLATFDSERVVYIATVESSRSVRTTVRVGETRAAHATATGKVFLAFMTQEERNAFFNLPLRTYTSHTIGEQARLEAELAEVRARGYATTMGEYSPEVASVAAPIFDSGGQNVAALALSGPNYRITPEVASQMAIPLMQATQTISARLGYRAYTPNL